MKLDLDAVMKCAGQNGGALRVKGIHQGQGNGPLSRHQTFAGKNGSGLTNWSKGRVAYPQIA